MNNWKIERGTSAARLGSANSRLVPLRWAHDAETGAARYIHDLEIVNGTSTCTCASCNLPLIPVLAGQPLRVRPAAHFRHPPGAQKAECTLVAARLAVTRHFLETGFIVLPRRRISSNAKGFSGQGYEVWVEVPAERRTVSGAVLHDYATALLTLDDGSELLVDLTGTRDVGGDGSGRAIVTLSLSDLGLATAAPDEIRARLQILPDIRWCSHWNDASLITEASDRANQAARDAFDGWGEAEENEFLTHLPAGINEETACRLRRETLLHREVKSVIFHASTVMTPGFTVTVTRDPPEEFGGDWEQHVVRRTWMTLPRALRLNKVILERRVGHIVPDVIANIESGQKGIRGWSYTVVSDDFEEEHEDDFGPLWPPTLLIEVTVTHGIDAQKLRLIRDLDLPTLEIDLSTLGGQVTLAGLRNLVVNEEIGKRWVHHPVIRLKEETLRREIDGHPVTLEYTHRLAVLRRPKRLATPVQVWVAAYIEAITRFHDVNAEIKQAIRGRQGQTVSLPFLGVDSQPWLEVAEAAECLDAHGFFGALEPEIVEETGLVPRILSIKHNRGVGYAVNTGYQVLNAIMQSGKSRKRWDSLYALAVNVYGLERQFSVKQAERYRNWRQSLIDHVKTGDKAYLRPRRFDKLLAMIFPELAAGIKNGFGSEIDRM